MLLRPSDLDRGTVALKQAYKNQRLTEARITALGYAPFIITRGQEKPDIDYLSRDRAERRLLDAVNDHPDARSHHALGRFYLAAGQFDKAIDQLDQALRQDPNSAQLQSDLGAALLEMGRQKMPGSDAGKELESLARSLDHINKALQLDPNLLEALYNKALVLQYMVLPEQARTAWEAYLAHDSQSRWAEEARRNLQLLSERSAASPTARQLLDAFVIAARARDDGRAWQIMSRNREMITRKLLSQQLAVAYLSESPDNRQGKPDEFLEALIYAGGLELERAHDPYVSEMAGYYTRASRQQQLLLVQAQNSVFSGYDLCLQTKYQAALEQFAQAKEQFDKAQNEWESRLCDYWIGYCYSQVDRLRESTTILTSLADYCQKNNYKWLLGQATCWIASNYAELGEHSKSLEYYNRALVIAEDIEDVYSSQKALSQLASEYNDLGQSRRALSEHWRSLQMVDFRYTSVRQIWRNYLYTARTLMSLSLYEAAAAFGDEMLRLATDVIKEPGIIHYSYLYLGQIYGGLRRYEEAIGFASESLRVGRSLNDEYAARKLTAYSVLQIAHLQRQAGNFTEALSDYDQAIQTYDQMELSINKYDAHKGRLLCRVALKDDAGVEDELSMVMELFTQSRTQILEEQNRNTFFDHEQSVYDIAIDHAYMKGDYLRAFDYSEAWRARSLLDALHDRAQVTGSPSSDAEIRFTTVSQPSGLLAIQRRMPANVQVLQYTILQDKTLIWLITKDSFKCEKRDISAADLQSKVSTYVKAVASGPGEETGSNLIAQELYDLIIGPFAGQLDPQKVLCIIPDKALFRLPFSALISPQTKHYLISDFMILSSPSLNVFLLCSDSARGKAGRKSETLLSVGNPSFDRQDYPTLPDLPAAAREAIEIARNYPAAYEFIGPAALKEPIRRKMADADVVHFACHYVANERHPMASKLILAKRGGESAEDDGGLTAHELLSRKLLRARLVILSACQTGGENYYNGEGMIGMSRTFLATGIPLVVASQWAVDSDSTAELMIKFHHYRKAQGLTTVAALRRAQLDMINDARGPYHDPYYWAAFMPAGGDADF